MRKRPMWQRYWTWPWTGGRPRDPVRGLEKMRDRRARGMVWKWRHGIEGGVRSGSYEVRAQR